MDRFNFKQSRFYQCNIAYFNRDMPCNDILLYFDYKKSQRGKYSAIINDIDLFKDTNSTKKIADFLSFLLDELNYKHDIKESIKEAFNFYDFKLKKYFKS